MHYLVSGTVCSYTTIQQGFDSQESASIKETQNQSGFCAIIIIIMHYGMHH